jgi:PAS domain S-box-containing protein
VLIVDDNAVDRERIRRHLGAGYETSEAATAEQARRAIDASAIDCVLLDYLLPDSDGLAFLDEILARGLPVVMLTGQGDETIAVEAMKRGAQDYMAKGRLDTQLIRRTITNAVEKKTLREEIERQHAELEARTFELELQRAELEHSNTALREREAKLRFVLEQLPAIVWTADAELRYTSVSGMRWRARGIDPATLVGATVGKGLVDDAGQESVLSAHRRALNGEPVQFEARHESAVYQGHVESVPDGSSAGVGLIGIAIDVSDTRRLEQQLRDAQKMDALGKLAGGVAHDFNNLLSVILGYSSMMAAELAAGDPMRADIDEIHAAGERATGLTRQLLSFSRQQMLSPKVVNLNDIVRGMENLLRRIIGEDVDLTTTMAPDLGKALVDPGQIEQIIMNLAVNARDAMPRGGKLTIETANIDLDLPYAAGHLGIKPGPHVMLAVTDTGEGMDEATQALIFEPFFTTKEVGKGTGLGLATVLGIVQQSGGGVWVYSEPGHGTAFKVYFPRTTSAASGLEPASRSGPVSRLRGKETILLVEDDDRVRNVIRTILHRYGYQVLEAQSGDEALLIDALQLAKISLLLTDLVMPRMNGRQLSEQLVQSNPRLRVLFMSGYTDDAVVRLGVLHSDIAFLQKPILPEELVRKVRELLDAPEKPRC